MKRVKKVLIVFFILIVGLGIFFIFHVPDSAESRVNKLTAEIGLYESGEAKDFFVSFMKKYNEEERLEIFEKLPFSMVRDNRVWLVDAMNQVLPKWVESEKFNAKYLSTELELEKKRNKRVIKNLKPVNEPYKFVSLKSFVKDVYKIGLEHWDIKHGDFYVVDNTMKAIVKEREGAYEVESISIKLFEIQNAYIFDVDYSNSILSIKPTVDKFEDNGAFELEEKMSFYQVPRFKKHFEKAYGIKTKFCNFELTDSLIDTPKNYVKSDSIEYLNIKYNRSKIEIVDKIEDLRYLGSLKIDFMDEKGENITKQLLLNLFKVY